MSEWGNEPRDFTSDYDPDIPECIEQTRLDEEASFSNDDTSVEPPHNENHYRYHTPAGPNPDCANCRYLNWHQEPENEPLRPVKHTPAELAEISKHEESLARSGANPYASATAVGYDDPEWVPIGDPFVVLWNDGSLTSKSEQWVSETYDLADCDYGEGVRAIYAPDQNGKLVQIRPGKTWAKINTDQEYPFRYARSPIMAGERIAGYVTLTDH